MKKYLLIDDEGQDPQGAVRLLREHGYRVFESADGVIPERESEIEAGRSWAADSAPGQTALPDIHASREAVLVAGAADGRVLDLNASFSELTGYGREELLGQPILGLSFFLNPESWRDALSILTGGGRSVDLETRILRRDGLVSFVKVFISNAEMDGMPGHLLTFRRKAPNASVGTLGGMSGFSIADPESLLSGDRNLSRQEIGAMIDYHALQDLMNSFHKATKLPMSITDINGNVLVAIGWQEICTRFHRLHPETLKNCMESDTYVTRNIAEGKYSLYKCRNNMWDIATPIIIGGKHIANIFMGQFLFDDEIPDYELFRKQAQTYGFDEKEYLAALDRVPRWSRQTIESSMEFFTKLAVLISRISIANIQLTQSLAQQQRISEELHQANLVVENSPVVLFRWRATEGWPVELVSANVVQFGYTRDELLSGAVTFAAMLHPEDLERVASEVAEYCAEGVKSFQQEYRIITKGGDIRWVYDRTVVERDSDGKISHYQGIVMDISRRKKAEDALKISHFIIDKASIEIMRGDGEARILSANEHAAKALGYSREEISSMSFFDIDPSLTREFWKKHRSKLAAAGNYMFESFHRRKDGTIYPVEVMIDYLMYGEQEFSCSFTTDITERKKAEDALRESEEKFRVLAETAPAAIVLHQGDRFIYANPATTSFFGYSEGELLKMNFWDWCGDNHKELIRERSRSRLRGEPAPSKYEHRLIAKSGEERWVIVSAGVIEYLGKPTVIATFLDNTEARRAEEELRLNAERGEALLQLNQMSGSTLDEIMSFAFEAAVRVTRSRLGYLAFMNEDESVMTMQLWSHEAMDECRVPGYPRIYPVATTGLWGEAVRQRRPVITNDYAAANPWKKGTPEGHVRLARHMNLPVIIDGRIVLVAGVGNKEEDYNEGDVNQLTLLMEGMWRLIERKRAEEQIRASLAEKSVLLKEVHHRVKNNLQIICSLLDLQSEGIRDGEALTAFRVSQDRIRAMALIHERLYKSADFTSIDFAMYIEDLSVNLLQTYMADPDRVALKIDCEEISIGLEQAIPCGLIINELITNAIKHAFPGNRQGEILVSFLKGEDGQITLRVADSGIGLPSDLDITRTGTLGMQLVTMLAKQLRGELTMEGNKGAAFLVRFCEQAPH